MHPTTFFAGLAALLPATLAAPAASAAAKPPTAFALQAKSRTTDPNGFDHRYVNAESNLPLLFHLNADAQFFSLIDPQTTKAGTFYSLQVQQGYGSTGTAKMEINEQPFGYWEPMTFVSGSTNGTKIPADETGFYINGTGTSMTLEWTKNTGNLQNSDFYGWLVCLWEYDLPQLFFKTEVQLKTYPSSCTEVDLRIIPLTSS